jgi:hypothetical protein
MAYSLETQYARDIDWFFIDRWRRICHVASAGGFIPELISENEESNEAFFKIVQQLPEKYDFILNPRIDEILTTSQNEFIENPRETYLKSFISMARKGIYSFDKTVLGDFEDPYYHLVARPYYEGMTEYPIDKSTENSIIRIKSPMYKYVQYPFELLSRFHFQNVFKIT